MRPVILQEFVTLALLAGGADGIDLGRTVLLRAGSSDRVSLVFGCRTSHAGGTAPHATRFPGGRT